MASPFAWCLKSEIGAIQVVPNGDDHENAIYERFGHL
ncbi:hypothetical protein HNR34_001846 [Geobacillus subterraneus]